MTSYEQLLLDSLDKRSQDDQFRVLELSSPKKARVWLLGAHERANMGDMALTYTAEVLLRRLYPTLEHVTLSRSVATHNWQKLKLLVKPEDLIFIPGGGNLGDLWLHEEAFRRLVVKTFNRNTIVVLPQSVHFSDSEERALSSEVYSSHERLFILARDPQSHERLKGMMPENRTALTPDLVFSYDYPVAFLPQDKSKLLMISRRDKEEGNFALHKWAKNQENFDFSFTDTVYDDLEFHGTSFAAKSVYKKIDECHSAGVVITNRLHGVIFGLLAGRPVIAYENSYGKIGGALKHLPETLSAQVHLLTEAPTEELVNELSRKSDAAVKPHELLREEFIALENRIRSFVQTPATLLIY